MKCESERMFVYRLPASAGRFYLTCCGRKSLFSLKEKKRVRLLPRRSVECDLCPTGRSAAINGYLSCSFMPSKVKKEFHIAGMIFKQI